MVWIYLSSLLIIVIANAVALSKGNIASSGPNTNGNLGFEGFNAGGPAKRGYLLVSRLTATSSSELWVYLSAIAGPLALGLISYLTLMGLAESRCQNIQE